jgi:hypothetical protein
LYLASVESSNAVFRGVRPEPQRAREVLKNIFGAVAAPKSVSVPEAGPLEVNLSSIVSSWRSDRGESEELSSGGMRAAEFSRTPLGRGHVHFIASDGHDLKHRPPKLNEAHAWLKENYGAEKKRTS